MKALKIILSIVGGLLALWMLLGLFAKKDYLIERSTEIDAPREIVHEQISFFKNLKNWSPWHVYDPNMKTSIEGTDGAPGAKYIWSGNDEVGSGHQLIKAITANRVDVEVMLNDFSTSPAYFQLEEMGKKTKITWGMNMHVPFPWNAFSMLTDVNSFVGKDYENGLANLKRVCEQIAHPKYRGYEVVEADMPVTNYAGVRQVVDFADIPQFFAENFSKAMEEATKSGANMAGAPCGFFWNFDTITMKTDMAAAIPLDKQVKLGSGVQAFSLGGPKALVVEYFGPYEKTAEAHYAMDDYMAEKKLRSIPPVIEAYITDPAAEPDTAKWLTKVIYFVEPKPDSTSVEKK
jgi:effector-binding domain-containing protein